jgi:hypothetical protein
MLLLLGVLSAVGGRGAPLLLLVLLELWMLLTVALQEGGH